MSQLVSFVISVVILVVILKIISLPIKIIIRLLANSILGLALIWVLGGLGVITLTIAALSWVSLAIIGFFGIPGAILVIVLSIFGIL